VTSSPDHNNKGLSFDRVSERLEYSHSTSVLPGLLHYGDAMSMAHGVESRNPFVDHRLVEWIFGVGTSFKVRQGESKWLIREFLRRRNQTAIGDRSDKLGFPTPVDRWLAANNGELAKRILLSNSAMLSEFCSPHKVRNILERHLLGKAGAGFHLYKLISLEFWLRSCMSTAAIRPS